MGFIVVVGIFTDAAPENIIGNSTQFGSRIANTSSSSSEAILSDPPKFLDFVYASR